MPGKANEFVLYWVRAGSPLCVCGVTRVLRNVLGALWGHSGSGGHTQDCGRCSFAESCSSWACAFSEIHSAFALAVDPSLGVMFLAGTAPLLFGVCGSYRKALSFSCFHLPLHLLNKMP